MKYGISTTDAPAALGSYSQGTSAARYIFVSGQTYKDPRTNTLIEGTCYQKTIQALQNCEAILEDVNLSRIDIAKTTVFVTDLADTCEIDHAFADFFTKPYPARTLVEVSKLPGDVSICIECIACR